LTLSQKTSYLTFYYSFTTLSTMQTNKPETVRVGNVAVKIYARNAVHKQRQRISLGGFRLHGGRRQ